MTCAVVGSGESGNGWHDRKHDISIGVNDAIKHGADFDYLVIMNSLNAFRNEQDRVSLIRSSKAKLLANNTTWGKCDLIRSVAYMGYLKKGRIYHSKTSPFVALSVAFNKGADEIIMYGVDMVTHGDYSKNGRYPKDFEHELRKFENITSQMKEQGTKVYVSSEYSELSKFLPVYQITIK